MKSCLFLAALLLCAGVQLCAETAAPAKAIPLTKGMRMVCVGDSITDGNTYPQIILQALKEAKKPVPTVICSGVVCDTIINMRDRVQKTVLFYQPKVVTVTAGTNDALHGESVAVYEQMLRDFVEKVQHAGAAVVLMTPCIINVGNTNKPHEAGESLGAQYIVVMHKLAQEKGLPLAENNALQRKARDAGQWIMSADGIHPNYLGQALMARSLLDAMGYADVPLPKTFKPQPYTGMIPLWKMRLTPIDAATKKPMALTAENINTLTPDNTWVKYTLPEQPMVDAKTGQVVSPEAMWEEQLYLSGFGTQVATRVGKGPVQAVATIKWKKTGTAYINVGGDMTSLWLNGKKLDMPTTNDDGHDCLIGFHAGKLRIPVVLHKGNNTLVMENPNGFFFVGVTKSPIWEDDYCKAYGK